MGCRAHSRVVEAQDACDAAPATTDTADYVVQVSCCRPTAILWATALRAGGLAGLWPVVMEPLERPADLLYCQRYLPSNHTI